MQQRSIAGLLVRDNNLKTAGLEISARIMFTAHTDLSALTANILHRPSTESVRNHLTSFQTMIPSSEARVDQHIKSSGVPNKLAVSAVK
jgi:hypothetical protein